MGGGRGETAPRGGFHAAFFKPSECVAPCLEDESGAALRGGDARAGDGVEGRLGVSARRQQQVTLERAKQ